MIPKHALIIDDDAYNVYIMERLFDLENITYTAITDILILEETLKTYAATIRWGDMTQALAFVDPKYRQEHPLSDLDLARYRQVQVTSYNDQPAAPISADEVGQTVEIGLVNVNTQAARSIVDRQIWHYDEKEKRWWLTTGLPDIRHHD